MKHDLEYVENDDEKGYGDGLDDAYRCSCGATFQANGDVVAAFEHGRDAAHEEAGGREPLVIVGIGGGLVQWDVVKPGVGEPRIRYLDYDIEGVEGEELLDFAERIEEAATELAEFGDDADKETLANMAESVREYRQMVAAGESPGRYR